MHDSQTVPTFTETAAQRPRIFSGRFGRSASRTAFGRSVIAIAAAVCDSRSAIGDFAAQALIALAVTVLALLAVAGLILEAAMGGLVRIANELPKLSAVRATLYLGLVMFAGVLLTLATGSPMPIFSTVALAALGVAVIVAATMSESTEETFDESTHAPTVLEQ